MMTRRVTRAEFTEETGIIPAPESVGALLGDGNILVIEYIFTDGSELDELESIYRLVDPR